MGAQLGLTEVQLDKVHKGINVLVEHREELDVGISQG